MFAKALDEKKEDRGPNHSSDGHRNSSIKTLCRYQRLGFFDIIAAGNAMQLKTLFFSSSAALD